MFNLLPHARQLAGCVLFGVATLAAPGLVSAETLDQTLPKTLPIGAPPESAPKAAAIPAESAPTPPPSPAPSRPANLFLIPDGWEPGTGAPAAPAAPTASATAPAPAAAPAPACADCCPDGAKPFDWSKIPVVSRRPPAGYTILFPTGPGYYTLVDQCLGNYREKAPAYPYARFGLQMYPLFDYSFAYLDKPDNTEHDWLDPLKRIHLGDDWLLSFGGELRVRTYNETDYAGNKAGTNNSYQQSRTRLFEDLWYKDLFRIYVEGIDARTWNADIPPAPNDENHFDLLDFFVDVKVPFLSDGSDRTSYVRAGRQELLYGSQRLISTVEWANTRVNFQGLKFFSQGKDFDFDMFVVQPVLHQLNTFDSVDDKQTFAAAWGTYRPAKGQLIDLYYLNLSNGNYTATGQKGVKGGSDINTLGTRYYGNVNGFLWDFEPMFQFSKWSNQTDLAFAEAAEVGYWFKDLAMTPQFWVGYDYSSGGADKNGTHHTFNQLFTFGHYYQGQADIVGRQNAQDIYTQFVFFPTNWITFYSQYHAFFLANKYDALYNKAGVASRQDPTGKAGVDVGQELDFILNFHMTNHSDFQVGYSHFFTGDFMKATGSGKDIDFTYVQYTFRF